MYEWWVDERYTIQSEVELHGGMFERELVYDHTNYLIVRNTMSEKYKTAIQWKKVIIVNEYWIQDSTRCGSGPTLYSSTLELMNPSDYQNYTQPQSTLASQSTTPSQRAVKEDSAVTSFTDSCLSMIQPLEKGRNVVVGWNIEYLTPNKTVARTRGDCSLESWRLEVDLLLDGYIFYLAIANRTSYTRVMSILCGHGAFW